MREALRAPRMAGSWYPAEGVELRRLLDSFAAELPHEGFWLDPRTRLAGLVCPHAGYLYSGRCAARAYATLGAWRPVRVVVLAPSHREWFPGVSCWSPLPGTPAPGRWATPLGEVELDLEFIQSLREHLPELRLGQEGHRAEHSLELQLPFLQHALGSFRLVPLVLGDQSPDLVRRLAQALAATLDEQPTLLVASTDLSHFHTQQEAGALDDAFLKTLLRADDEALLEALRSGACEACGGGPVAAMLGTLRRALGRARVRVLDYRSSAEVTGETASVVGYGSALILEDEDD